MAADNLLSRRLGWWLLTRRESLEQTPRVVAGRGLAWNRSDWWLLSRRQSLESLPDAVVPEGPAEPVPVGVFPWCRAMAVCWPRPAVLESTVRAVRPFLERLRPGGARLGQRGVGRAVFVRRGSANR
jgi:hypothetical protein